MTEFAQQMGVARTTVWRWETGRMLPTGKQLEALENMLEKDREPLECAPDASKVSGDRYMVELTDEQVRVVINALEEYFRLRMGQEFEFCNDMASLNTDLSPENENHEWIFDKYISRRDHLQELLRAFFRIAFEPDRYLKVKTDDMLIAECVWDAMRVATGRSRWGSALQVGKEPSPRIKRIG